jgi:hypothetical protein
MDRNDILKIAEEMEARAAEWRHTYGHYYGEWAAKWAACLRDIAAQAGRGIGEVWVGVQCPPDMAFAVTARTDTPGRETHAVYCEDPGPNERIQCMPPGQRDIQWRRVKVHGAPEPQAAVPAEVEVMVPLGTRHTPALRAIGSDYTPEGDCSDCKWLRVPVHGAPEPQPEVITDTDEEGDGE